MSQPSSGMPVWRDPTLPVHDRVEALLAAMTLDEKLAQLGSRWVFDHVWQPAGDEGDHHVAPVSAMADADSAAGLASARDPVAQVVRPVRQLAGYARVGLAPGGAADVTFRLHADRTSYPGPDLRRIVEAGDVELLVGTSARDLPWRTTVRLTGATRGVGSDRRLGTPVQIVPVAAPPS